MIPSPDRVGRKTPAAADLGHGRSGTVQEPRAHVLPERTRRRRRLRHHFCRASPPSHSLPARLREIQRPDLAPSLNGHCLQPSLVKARSWIAELQRQADPGIVVMLVGNKLDLAEAGQRQVSTEEAQKFADEEGLMFMEVSAKTAQGVKEVFDKIGEPSSPPRRERPLSPVESVSS